MLATYVYSSRFFPVFLGGGGGARFILEMSIFSAYWERANARCCSWIYIGRLVKRSYSPLRASLDSSGAIGVNVRYLKREGL
jgi:hypothetical protein